MKTNLLYAAALVFAMASCKKEETKTETTVIEPKDTVATAETATVPMDSAAM